MDAIIFGGGRNRYDHYKFACSQIDNFIIVSANHWSMSHFVKPDYIAFIDRIDGPIGARVRQNVEFAARHKIKTISTDGHGQTTGDIIILNRSKKKIFDSGQLATYYAIKNVSGLVYLCGVDMRHGTWQYTSCRMKWKVFLSSLSINEIIRIRWL